MADPQAYRVLRSHIGDRPYLRDEIRSADPSDVKHLVPHVLQPIDGKADAPVDNKAEGAAPANKAGRAGATKKTAEKAEKAPAKPSADEPAQAATAEPQAAEAVQADAVATPADAAKEGEQK